MLYDTASNLIHELQNDLASLARKEQNAQTARQLRDTTARNQAESEARWLRTQLIQHDASLVFHHLDTSRMADPDKLRREWVGELPRDILVSDPITDWFYGIVGPPDDLRCLPPGSFLITFKFMLAKPYLSRDDEELSITDNPIIKEQVFGLPMVTSTAWKGSVRAALRATHGWQENGADKVVDPNLARLCGVEPEGRDKPGRAGRLRCFPTFFNRIGIETVSPHRRDTKTGKPILIESVPQDAEGCFALLYVPFDGTGPDDPNPASPESVAAIRTQAIADLQNVVKAIPPLFREHGIGAKTSSGYGRAAPGVTEAKLSFVISPTAPPISESFDSFDALATAANNLTNKVEQS